MQGKTLRVSYPGDSSSDYTLVTRDDNGQKTGSVVAFMNEIAAKGGFFFELHNVSGASTIQAYELASTEEIHGFANAEAGGGGAAADDDGGGSAHQEAEYQGNGGDDDPV